MTNEDTDDRLVIWMVTAIIALFIVCVTVHQVAELYV